jgi:electron transfer flavoprotein beta subunit
MTLSVALLASVGRNPVSGQPRASRNDVVALELARGLADISLTVFHAGPGDRVALTDYLAYGAPGIVQLEGEVLPSLVAHLAGVDLILCGSRAETGEESGMLPYLVAERLGRPLVPQAIGVSLAEGQAEIEQFLPKGARRRVAVPLPAVVVVHPLAPVAPRYAHARKSLGRITKTTGVGTAAVTPDWPLETASALIVPLKAVRREAGHTRMLSAIASASKGGTILNEGDAADKARAILSYLRRHGLTGR